MRLPFEGVGSARGAVIAIGGAEDKAGSMEVLRRVLAEAKSTNVHVITTATSHPASARERYGKAFHGLNVASCSFSHIDTRAQANDPALAREIGAADIVFLSGGDQLKLTHILGGTAVLEAVRQAHENGTVIAGTSAGAAMQASLMIYGGDVTRALHKGAIKAAPGFGFIDNCAIDTHFSQRNRLLRLFALVSMNPGLRGIGLDEDTAVIANSGSPVLEIVGSGTVTIVDGAGCRSNVADVSMGEPFEASGFTVHALKVGERFDLEKMCRLPVIGPAKSSPGPA